MEVYPVDMRVGVRADRLLDRIDAGSEIAVYAFVVAVADLAGGAVTGASTSRISSGSRHTRRTSSSPTV